MLGLQQYEIYSEKYGVRGIINHLSDNTAVEFLYDKTYFNRRIEKEWPEGDEAAIEALGLEAMEEYIERILAGEVEVEKVRLYNWYVEEVEKNGEKYLRANGNVTGHYRLWDSDFIHTSEIESIDVQEESGEVVICTQNTRYHCFIHAWDYAEQDKYTNVFSNYTELKEKYKGKHKRSTMEPGKVLLCISNYDSYYFHDLYYKPVGAKEPVEYKAFPHVGTFQDSFLIWVDEGEIIDLRYFPHPGNIEFYVQCTNEKPWFVENVGDTTLYAKTFAGTIKLDPGERKEVKEDNAEKERVDLPGGDLYPAEILE